MSVSKTVRVLVGAAALAVVAPGAVLAGSADAATSATSSITVKASDATPASGQTFTVSGLFVDNGAPADHELVKVQSFSGGTWVPITGAQVDTTSTGTYQLRLILQAKGLRDLRVTGIVPGPAHDVFKRFTVTVH